MIDLTTITIEEIDGTKAEIPFAKDLAQVIYQSTRSVAEHTLAVEMYKTGQIPNTEEAKKIVTAYAENATAIYVQNALKKKLDESN